jgi:DNA ligase-1
VPSFLEFAEVCRSLGQTGSRLQMAGLAGDFLARLDADEAGIAARFMIGRALEQGDEQRLNVSGRAVWKIAAEIGGGADQGEDIFTAATDFGEAVEMVMRLRPAEPAPTLTIAEVARCFAGIGAIEGRQSRARKLGLLRELLERATALEAGYIAKILVGEMRHGIGEGLLLEAIARMANKPAGEVRRLHMLEGDPGRVVRILRGSPPARPAGFLLRPLKPMLAHPVHDVAEALAMLGPRLALEHKLDGARVQIHRDGAAVKIFSRRMNEITPSLPEIAEAITRIDKNDLILHGEVIAVDEAAARLPFRSLCGASGEFAGSSGYRASSRFGLLSSICWLSMAAC